jgi:hypothetical protein
VANNKQRNWKTLIKYKKIKLNWESNEITHPKDVGELFNSYFSRIAKELLKQNCDRITSYPRSQLKINICTKTIFLFSLTETEVENVVKRS